MAQEWEKSFQEFLKYAGKELRRAGNELKQEAQELLDNQEKLKLSLQKVADWAKTTAKEVAEIAQKHAQDAENKWSQKTRKGFCGFGKKDKEATTWGEPVEKMRTEPPPKTQKAAEPKAKSKTKKASAPKAAAKTAKPKKQATAKKAGNKPATKTPKAKRHSTKE